jgi:hypothetical protein
MKRPAYAAQLFQFSAFGFGGMSHASFASNDQAFPTKGKGSPVNKQKGPVLDIQARRATFCAV